MPIPFSYAVTIASGDNALVNVPFPYLLKAHVHVKVGALGIPDQDLVWLAPNQIRLPSAPAAGAHVKVFRITPADLLLTVWSTPNVFDHRDLNAAMKQLLYICQESFDASANAAQIVADILDYLDQIVTMYQDILAKWNEIVEIWGNSHLYHDYPTSLTYVQTIDTDIGHWVIPEALTVDVSTIARMFSYTSTPPGGNTQVDVLIVSRTTGDVLQRLGAHKINTGNRAGTFEQDVGLVLPYHAPAGCVLTLRTVAVHASLLNATYTSSLRKVVIS